ncbi:hypothetical protein Y032_0011g1244 [Ancylostoma ceylanicum]|nr:hypothetical protein Y032_0011g1244 [Ancylostoma ceylanicum]
MSSANAYALPEPAVGEPDGCGKTDLPAHTVPYRHASTSHVSRLASRYNGPRFQPGLSWPDKSRWTRLLSAAAEARLSFQSRLPAYIRLGCHVAMKKKTGCIIPA